MELLRIEMTGAPLQALPEAAHRAAAAGLVGVDVTARSVEGVAHTVVQALFDDDRPGFDRSLLDGPLVADLLTPSTGVLDGGADVLDRALFDHDEFRRRLLTEREAGESITRGVLVLTDGEVPPPWIRLAFLPVELSRTAGAELVVRRSSVEELAAAVDAARRVRRAHRRPACGRPDVHRAVPPADRVRWVRRTGRTARRRVASLRWVRRNVRSSAGNGSSRPRSSSSQRRVSMPSRSAGWHPSSV